MGLRHIVGKLDKWPNQKRLTIRFALNRKTLQNKSRLACNKSFRLNLQDEVNEEGDVDEFKANHLDFHGRMAESWMACSYKH